jgi:hypothetical protein
VNFQISVKVEGDGFPADISCFKKIADFTIKTELSEIRGKYEQSVRLHPGHRQLEESDMVTLDIKDPVVFFGVGKRRWIDIDQVIGRPVFFKPLQAIGLDRTVIELGKSVQVQIHPGPPEIIGRQVDSCGSEGAGHGGVESEGH